MIYAEYVVYIYLLLDGMGVALDLAKELKVWVFCVNVWLYAYYLGELNQKNIYFNYTNIQTLCLVLLKHILFMAKVKFLFVITL